MSARGGPGRLAIPAVAATTLVGTAVYYSTRPAKSQVEQRRDRVQSKRSEGLTGTGVGGNATTGGHETGQVGSGTSLPTHDQDRALKTDTPSEKLPSGGVGGGVGGGGTNTRATEFTSKKDGQQQTVTSTGGGSAGSEGTGQSQSGGSGSHSWSQALQGAFGQGGKSATDDPELHGNARQTKVASNLTTSPSKNPNGRQ